MKLSHDAKTLMQSRIDLAAEIFSSETQSDLGIKSGLWTRSNPGPRSWPEGQREETLFTGAKQGDNECNPDKRYAEHAQ